MSEGRSVIAALARSLNAINLTTATPPPFMAEAGDEVLGPSNETITRHFLVLDDADACATEARIRLAGLDVKIKHETEALEDNQAQAPGAVSIVDLISKRGPMAKESRWLDALVEAATTALWLQISLNFHRIQIADNVVLNQTWELVLRAKAPSETASALR